PDAKYVVMIRRENDGRDSVWMRHLPTNSTSQIVPPGDAQYDEVTFGPDANYVYLRSFDKKTAGVHDLNRVAVLGGAVIRVVHNIDSPPSFYGDRLCFIRHNSPASGSQQLVISRFDGSDEKVIHTDHEPQLFAPAWSPDGKSIVVSNVLPSGSEFYSVDVASGDARKFFTLQKYLEQVQALWTPAGDGLILLVRNLDNGKQQIAYLSYPGAIFHKITNDTSSYGRITTSQDGRTLATSLHTATYEDQVFAADAVPDISKAGVVAGGKYLDWIDNDRLLIGDTEGYSLQVATLAGPSTLFSSPDLHVFDANVCGGHAILFAGEAKGNPGNTQIWSMDLQGNNLKQITQGPADQYARCSADGKWMAYTDFNDNSIKRVRLETGQTDTFISPDRLPNARNAVSLDGTQLVAITHTVGDSSRSILSFVSFETGQTLREIPVAGDARSPAAVPGGKLVAYVLGDRGADNIWLQPTDGGPAKQWTQFHLNRESSSIIGNVAWSPDSKRVAMTHAFTRGDAILLQDQGK
ncbi:MAG TPA: hypothetical protein VI386_03430, partial [Candidatus Sulfotelmatobacter sp.]